MPLIYFHGNSNTYSEHKNSKFQTIKYYLFTLTPQLIIHPLPRINITLHSKERGTHSVMVIIVENGLGDPVLYRDEGRTITLSYKNITDCYVDP